MLEVMQRTPRSFSVGRMLQRLFVFRVFMPRNGRPAITVHLD